MKSKIITRIGLLALSLCLPAAAWAAKDGEITKVAGKGDTGFYYAYDSENIARFKAKEKLERICKKKNMRFYEGKYNLKTQRNSLVSFNGMQCKEGGGGKRCTVQASGYCVSKLSTYFNFSCGKGKPRAEGILLAMPSNTFRLLADNGNSVNLHAADVNAQTVRSLCHTEEHLDTLIDKLTRYVRQNQSDITGKCKAIAKERDRDIKKGRIPKELPESCKGGGSSGKRG